MAVRVGLIGAGRMGQTMAQHLAYSVEEADFVAIADQDLNTARKVAERCRVKHVYQDYNALLQRDDVSAVVIVTPTNTHVDVIRAAAAAGKHIFTEKPLALDLVGCDAALAAVSAAGVKLQVGFMRRFDPAYAAAKSQIDEGVIGQPVTFKAVGRDAGRTGLEYARRENSGGLIMDMGIHEFDLARWLMGSEVVRVQSEGSTLVFPELAGVGDIDSAMINLRFANEAVGHVDTSRTGLYGYDIRTEIVGSEGTLFVGALQQTDTLLLSPAGVVHDTYPGFMERFAAAFAAEMREFVAAVNEDRETTVSGSDARAATAIAVAATLSLDTGQPVDVVV